MLRDTVLIPYMPVDGRLTSHGLSANVLLRGRWLAFRRSTRHSSSSSTTDLVQFQSIRRWSVGCHVTWTTPLVHGPRPFRCCKQPRRVSTASRDIYYSTNGPAHRPSVTEHRTSARKPSPSYPISCMSATIEIGLPGRAVMR